MHTVRVLAEVSDEMYAAYQSEAARRGVPLEALIQQTVNCLLHELDEEEKEGTGSISPS
jgi:hypothetical protein